MPRQIPTDLSPWKRLALLPEPEREAFFAKHAAAADVSPDLFLARLSRNWDWIGRPKQHPPPGEWLWWFIRAGRGFGKTLSAAQWVRMKAEQPFLGTKDEEGYTWRIALVAPTLADIRLTMVEGETGLLSILPNWLLRGESRETAWNRSTCELYLSNGGYLRGFSSETPNRLRGPQHHYLWGEEVSSWLDARLGDKVDTTISNAKLGLRLGERPQAVLTSTPKNNKLTKDVLAFPSLVLAVGSSYENRDNLPEAWWQAVVAPLEGTRTGRQEIMAEMLEDVEGALWTQAQLDDRRVSEPPQLQRIIVAVDPNVSSEEGSNEAGIVVAGHDGQQERKGYVLADRTVAGGPRAWAQAAVRAYHEFNADRIVAEKNNGGEMVELTIHTVDGAVPVKLVSASRGKRVRAEPVAALYESSERHPLGRIFHAGVFPELEEQMTTWTPDAESPDRMDACLVAGTLVRTERGDVPIERLAVGERVLTRAGWRPVLRAGMTQEYAETITVDLSSGESLTGTKTHPVWVEGEGFRPMDALVCGDRLLPCRNVTTSGSTESATRDSRAARGSINGITGGLRAVPDGRLSIARFGRNIAGRYRKGRTSTTSTATLLTTTSKTLLASRRWSTPLNTPTNSRRLVGRRWTERESSHPNGIALTMAAPGIESTDDVRGKGASLSLLSACSAAKRLSVSRRATMRLASVVEGALARLLTQKAVTRWTPYVLSTASRSDRTSTGRSPKHARVNVVRSYASGVAAVYNLEVEGQPEYFANGVLVHNCVWALTELMLQPQANLRSHVPRGRIMGPQERIALQDLLGDPSGSGF